MRAKHSTGGMKHHQRAYASLRSVENVIAAKIPRDLVIGGDEGRDMAIRFPRRLTSALQLEVSPSFLLC